MGRRQDGGFDIRTIDGQHILKSVPPKKRKLIYKRKTFLTAIKKEGLPHLSKDMVFRTIN